MQNGSRKDLIQNLRDKALEIKLETVKLAVHAGEGHCASALSMADILAVLYFYQMHHNPKKPEWEDRDRYILSKGHGCLGLYSALYLSGYFNREKLYTFLEPNSGLPGHPLRCGAPGVEASTGSLGQGMSIAVGMAISAKMDNKKHYIYCLVGDGECNEGIVWEAALLASHRKLDNLVCIIDRNNYQCDGPGKDILDMGEMDKKWQSFGWEVMVCDGHNIENIIDIFDQIPFTKNKPSLVVANTIKGKGVSFMESSAQWHYRAPGEHELEDVLSRIKKSCLSCD